MATFRGPIAFPCAFVLAMLAVSAMAATIKVNSTTGILDADGVTPLQGNGLGSASSDKIQAVYAGPNGIIQPPGLDGLPTGDDELLETSEYAGQFYTAIGEGFPFNPNEGKFNEDFVHSLPAGAKIYVRAWNSPTIGEGAKYGDSALYTISNAVNETRDFGTWTTNKSAEELPWGGLYSTIAVSVCMMAAAMWRLRGRRAEMK